MNLINTVNKCTGKISRRFGYDVRFEPLVNADKRWNLDLYRKVYGEQSVRDRRFYNFGAGNFFHPAWTNVDYAFDYYKKYKGNTRDGIQYNLLSLAPVPVASDTAELVYSSHTVEHITDAAAQNLFNESYRMLKKGGICRITTPNIDLGYRAYRDNDRFYFYWIDDFSIPGLYEKLPYDRPLNQATIGQIFLTHFATNVSVIHTDGANERISDEALERLFSEKSYEEALNAVTSKCSLEKQQKYPGNHLNWWNQKKMFQMLAKAGFSAIRLSAYGQSNSPALRDTQFFDLRHPLISLYVEATK